MLQLIHLLRTTILKVDVVASIVDVANIPTMIKDAERFRQTMIEDYENLKSLAVKEIALEEYQNINTNIRTLKFVMKHHKDVVPIFERIGN